MKISFCSFFGAFALPSFTYFMILMLFINEVYYHLSFSWWGTITLVLSRRFVGFNWNRLIWRHTDLIPPLEAAVPADPKSKIILGSIKGVTFDLLLITSHVTWDRELISLKLHFFAANMMDSDKKYTVKNRKGATWQNKTEEILTEHCDEWMWIC